MKNIIPAHEKVFDYIVPLYAKDGVIIGYIVTESFRYFSKRYNKWISCTKGDTSDGATCAPDLLSFGWIIHDQLCATGKFDDGSICTNWQASSVLGDILKAEGRWFRGRSWFVATWLFGGGKARGNGMF